LKNIEGAPSLQSVCMNEIRKESFHSMNKIVSTTNGKPFTPKPSKSSGTMSNV
jgi:hypothetical protein